MLHPILESSQFHLRQPKIPRQLAYRLIPIEWHITSPIYGTELSLSFHCLTKTGNQNLSPEEESVVEWLKDEF